jgi:hypothetical protein
MPQVLSVRINSNENFSIKNCNISQSIKFLMKINLILIFLNLINIISDLSTNFQFYNLIDKRIFSSKNLFFKNQSFAKIVIPSHKVMISGFILKEIIIKQKKNKK